MEWKGNTRFGEDPCGTKPPLRAESRLCHWRDLREGTDNRAPEAGILSPILFAGLLGVPRANGRDLFNPPNRSGAFFLGRNRSVRSARLFYPKNREKPHFHRPCSSPDPYGSAVAGGIDRKMSAESGLSVFKLISGGI